MVSELSFSTASIVIDTWERIRNIPDFHKVLGVELFLIFFKMQPDTKKIFGLAPLKTEDELLKSTKFVSHARHYIQMIDRAVDLLGPNIEMLTEILLDLGAQHSRYGSRPHHYIAMTQALVEAIQNVLGKSFDEVCREAWIEVFDAMVTDMIIGQTRAEQDQAPSS